MVAAGAAGAGTSVCAVVFCLDVSAGGLQAAASARAAKPRIVGMVRSSAGTQVNRPEGRKVPRRVRIMSRSIQRLDAVHDGHTNAPVAGAVAPKRVSRAL